MFASSKFSKLAVVFGLASKVSEGRYQATFNGPTGCANVPGCVDGPQTEADCQAFAEGDASCLIASGGLSGVPDGDYLNDRSWSGTQSWSNFLQGCIIDYADGATHWNAHPVGGFMGTPPRLLICDCATPAPTPTPTLPGMSGDPIVRVNGFKVKFDLPVAKSTLMWEDGFITLYAKADVLSADKRSQWFSEFTLWVMGETRAVIQRRKMHPGLKAELDMLNTLSLTIFDSAGFATKVEKVGTHSRLGDERVQIAVQPLNRTVGGLRSEAVNVKSECLDFSVVAEVAKKFGVRSEALKYEHLDITMQGMRAGAKAGLFAEIYGFVPMSADTASMMRSVTTQ